MDLEVRTNDDISNLMDVAKLNPADHLNLTQVIHFSECLNSTEYAVFEIDEELLNDLNSDNSLIIKGQEDETAVLCTKNKTFDMREAETSNSILFIENLKVYDKKSPADFHADNDKETVQHAKVVFMRNTYFELKQCIPKLEKLKELLNECPYLGHIEEQDAIERNIIEKRYTHKELLNLVQASEAELAEGLRTLRSLTVDGYVRVLSMDYENEVLQAILNYIEEMSWSRSNVSVDQCCLELSSLYPSSIVHQVLEHYSLPVDDEEEPSHVSIIDNAVCRHAGENLLRHTMRFHLEDFLKVWQEVVPEGMTVSLNQLEGIAMVDHSSQPKSIWLFRAIDLPSQEEERFELLFQKKTHWSLEEITPYLRDLCPGGTTAITSMLNKHCRTSTIKGKRFYTSKAVK